MKRLWSFVFLFVCTLCIILYWVTSHQEAVVDRTGHKPVVVCTTSMIGDVLKIVGADDIELHILMGPGVDPHTYRMKEGDAHLLARADVVLYNGLHLEGKIADLLEQMSHARTCAVAAHVPVSDLMSVDIAGVYDPHVWHAVPLWRTVVKIIGEQLCAVDSAHAPAYQERCANFDVQLQELDAWVRERINTIPAQARILVTAHDAFAYFGKSYGFTVAGLQGVSTDADIGTQDVQKLADYIVTHRVKALFVESCVPTRNLEAVQYAVKARGSSVVLGGTLYADALSDASAGAHTYCDMIRSNVNAIVHALQ